MNNHIITLNYSRYYWRLYWHSVHFAGILVDMKIVKDEPQNWEYDISYTRENEKSYDTVIGYFRAVRRLKIIDFNRSFTMEKDVIRRFNRGHKIWQD